MEREKNREKNKKEIQLLLNFNFTEITFQCTLAPQKELMQHAKFIQVPHIQKCWGLLHIESFWKESKMNKPKPFTELRQIPCFGGRYQTLKIVADT